MELVEVAVVVSTTEAGEKVMAEAVIDYTTKVVAAMARAVETRVLGAWEEEPLIRRCAAAGSRRRRSPCCRRSTWSESKAAHTSSYSSCIHSCPSQRLRSENTRSPARGG